MLPPKEFTDPSTAKHQENQLAMMSKFAKIEFHGGHEPCNVDTGSAIIDEDAEMQPVPTLVVQGGPLAGLLYQEQQQLAAAQALVTWGTQGCARAPLVDASDAHRAT